MDQDLRQQMGVILRRNGKAQAIIALRARTGMPLHEADAVIEGLPTASDPMDLPRRPRRHEEIAAVDRAVQPADRRIREWHRALHNQALVSEARALTRVRHLAR